MTSIIGAGTGNSEQQRQYQHYADVRHRLMFGRPRPVIAPPTAVEPPVPVIVKPVGRAPLDMLAPPSVRFLIKLAALRHRMPIALVKSRDRLRPVVLARREAICLVFQHTQLSLPAVGRHFEQDHTTILHALRRAGKNQKLVDLRPSMAARARPKAPAASKPVDEPKLPKAPTSLQQVVRRAYQFDIKPSVIAEHYGCNPKSVKVIAHRLGLKRSDAGTNAG